MAIVINIPNLIKAAEGVPATVDSQIVPTPLSGFNLTKGTRSSQYLDKEQLISDLKIGDMEFPPTMMVVSSKKHIVTTVLAGQNDPVNEIISNGLYEVKLAGALIGADGFPLQELQELADLLKQKTALKIQCEYLRIFDIHQIVFTDENYPDAAGYDNVVVYDLAAISDTPIELELKNGILS